jgi:hypothetical protein
MQMDLPRFSKAVLGSLFTLALTASITSIASGQDNLLGVLKKKYTITQITTTGEIANPGVVMTVQANGINAEPYPTMITFENPVVDGAVQQRSKFTGLVKSQNLHILQPGERVYITKINSKTDDKKNDYLKITILTCDPVQAFFTTGPDMKRLSTTLSFKQPKGSLAEMSPDDASRMIEAILSQDNGGGQGEQGPPQQQQAPPQQRQAAPVQRAAAPVAASAPAPDSSAPPQTIALGQTIGQVVAIMGQPKQIIDLGSKKTYKYPDLKVVFLNGTVSDVQ